ncbi:MAG: hypothetical protein AAF658_15635 [Myxococcota bacterium]
MTTLDSVMARYDSPTWGLAFWRGPQPNGKISLKDTGLEVTGRASGAPFIRDASALNDTDFADLADRMSVDAAKAFLYNKHPEFFDRWDRNDLAVAGVRLVKARDGKIDLSELGVYHAPRNASIDDIVSPLIDDAARTLEPRELPVFGKILYDLMLNEPLGTDFMFALAAEGRLQAKMQSGQSELREPPLPPK